MSEKYVTVSIRHGGEIIMEVETVVKVLPENVPATARALMDQLYVRINDHVSAAQLRTKRRRTRAKKRAGNNGKIVLDGGEEAGE